MEYGSKWIPTEIRQKTEERTVVISFNNGDTFEYSMEFLRVFCPCAECMGHHPSQAKLIYGKRSVQIEKMTPIGHYALKINFDDSHGTGVYSWDTLFDLGKNQQQLWQEYLEELKQAGKSRTMIPIAIG
ncbi:MAG: DUF971 domain-containing protein [Magnetococcales bacterium]|nr:DUF971 domain-containing protein [Magnetococcales bacterium]